ncbi:MAG: DUF1772 domain-containing protein [Thermoleophilia bacterium]|nr:DUF1772 domain-containing protein [Thermoleophilia bacterium]
MIVLRFVNVFAGGVAAGGLFVVLVAYAHALRSLPAAAVGPLHGFFHPRVHVWMMGTTIVGAIAAVAVAALDDPGANAATVLPLVGILGGATQAILSRFWVVPASDEIVAWGESPPADAAAALRSWTLLHTGRVVGAVFAFVCYLLAALLA